MTSSNAPRLLVHEGSSRLRAALRHAQAQGPSDAELQAMFDGVALTVASSEHVLVPYALGAPRTWPPAAGTRWRPWVIGASVALLAGLSGWMLARKQSEQARSTAAPTAIESKANGIARTAQGVSASVPMLTQSTELTAPQVGPEAPPDLLTDPPQLPKRRARVATAQTARTAVVADEWLDQSAAENALLEPAVKELRGQRFEAAIERATEHEQRFPQGSLSQTREVLLIEALLMLGRRSEALSRAALFRERYPDSLYREKLNTLLLER